MLIFHIVTITFQNGMKRFSGGGLSGVVDAATKSQSTLTHHPNGFVSDSD